MISDEEMIGIRAEVEDTVKRRSWLTRDEILKLCEGCTREELVDMLLDLRFKREVEWEVEMEVLHISYKKLITKLTEDHFNLMQSYADTINKLTKTPNLSNRKRKRIRNQANIHNRVES